MQAGESAGDEVERSLQLAAEHRRKAEHWERRAAAFAQGQRGELAVASVLAGLLPHGYLHFNDVHFPGSRRANVDHVVVGPAGVLVVDAKDWSGTVTAAGGELRQNGYRRQEKVEVVKAGCEAIANASRLPLSLFTPVVCLTGSAQLPSAAVVHGAVALNLSQLPTWLETRPVLLPSAGEVEVVFDRLRDNLLGAGQQARGRPSLHTQADSRVPPRSIEARRGAAVRQRARSRRGRLSKLAAFLEWAPRVAVLVFFMALALRPEQIMDAWLRFAQGVVVEPTLERLPEPPQAPGPAPG